MNDSDWWRGAVIYQIYPRSFFDTNADGIGDLKGIASKLDYVADLGVDAIWLSPFYQSPMKDFGYDISDYRKVDPIFGDMEDFEILIDKAHQLGLKVLIDQVLSHTSDQHAWFKESQQNRDNDKADWYVWADAKGAGQVPNNWLSIFGGSAWHWHEGRQQYYLHNFLSSQPDLNYHNPEVQNQALRELEFWLKKGVDGFRLDAINYCFHDRLLRDNPLKPPEERKARGFSEDNPYAAQYHFYDNNRPEIIDFLKSIRSLLDSYDNKTTIAEINTEDSLESISEYTTGKERLHLGYSFELLSDEGSPEYIRKTVEALETKLGENMGCWAISNHDVERVVSRWGMKDGNPQFAKMLSIMLGSLRGTICTYQGEELGLTEADIQFEHIMDPFGKQFWPEFKGRDGCRTPMPWASKKENLGFSCAKPWLPSASAHAALSVDNQSKQKDSPLTIFKQFYCWRKKQSALVKGDIEFIHANKEILAFVRKSPDQQLLCVFNFSCKDEIFNIPSFSLKATDSNSACFITGLAKNNSINLPAFGVFFAELDS